VELERCQASVLGNAREYVRCRACGKSSEIGYGPGTAAGEPSVVRLPDAESSSPVLSTDAPILALGDPRTSKRAEQPLRSRIRVKPDALELLGFDPRATTVKFDYEYLDGPDGRLHRVEYLTPCFADNLSLWKGEDPQQLASTAPEQQPTTPPLPK
jgi:hypothetical protein